MNTFKISVVVMAMLLLAGTASAQVLMPKEQLGKRIFFDTNLSAPTGQSCAACHGPEVGFTGPVSDINATTVVYPGAINTRFGNRKPPSAAYGGASPVMSYDTKEDLFIGGMFWDGRATGWELDDPLAEQARGPFLNPLEQNMPSKLAVIDKIRLSEYSSLFEQVYGSNAWNDTDDAYNKVAEAIATYERSSEVNPFTSKYDYYLKGQVKLSKLEHKGLVLFNSRGKCSKCHLSKRGPKGEHPVFTDFTYDNLGIPKNPSNPFYTMPVEFNPDGAGFIDYGLSEFLGSTIYSEYASENYGKQKVPTLRNVDKRPYDGFVKAYGHNGYFKTLKDIVHFYNTRDVGVWPPPEVPEGVNEGELGDLGLSSEEEDAIVAFLGTLSDGYVIPGSRNTPALVTESPLNSGLSQNTPNPFNPVTTITYSIAEDAYVTLKVYDVVGREVVTLISEYQYAGPKTAKFIASELPSGVYFYRLQAGDVVDVKKMLLMR